MKRCGYAAGVCTSPCECNMVSECFLDANGWTRMRGLARICPYFVEEGVSSSVRLRGLRRRRDWRVGNPYGRA